MQEISNKIYNTFSIDDHVVSVTDTTVWEDVWTMTKIHSHGIESVIFDELFQIGENI
jgi:hypothetical protein